MIIRPADGRAVGMCISGQKAWFKTHGLDFRDFVRNGIDDSKVAHIDDANARRLIEHVKEAENGRRR